VHSTAFLSHTTGRCRPYLLQRACALDAASLWAHVQAPVVHPDLPLRSPINRGMCAACAPHRRHLPSPVNCAATIHCFPHFTAVDDSSLRPPTCLMCRSWRSSPSGRSSLCPPCHLPVTGALPHRCRTTVRTHPLGEQKAHVIPSSASYHVTTYSPSSMATPEQLPTSPPAVAAQTPPRTDEVHPSRCRVILACRLRILLARRVCKTPGPSP
jgi:hypothetical protein